MSKKCLLYGLLALMAVGCTQQGRWNREQRREMRQNLQDYRDMVYLDNMTDAEYVIFTDNVAEDLESMYPSYVTFVSMPGVNDTVQAVIVTTIVSDLKANHRNMRHIFPYRDLTDAGVLPTGMHRDQLTSFYDCLARKINDYYGGYDSFLYAMMNYTVDDDLIYGYQQECASPYVDTGSSMLIIGD